MNNEVTTSNRSRKCTDVPGLIILGILLTFIITYCIISFDKSLLIGNRDDCGNVCGELNLDNPYDQCGSRDKRNEPFVLAERHNDSYSIFDYSCINSCPENYTEMSNHCWLFGVIPLPQMTLNNFLKDTSIMLMSNWFKIAIFCPFCFIFFVIIIILLQLVPKTTAWISHIATIVALFIISTLFLFLSMFISWWDNLFFLALWITFYDILILVWFCRKMKALAKMLTEAANTILVILKIILVPLITFLILIIWILLFLVTARVIETSGDFVPTYDDETFKLIHKDTNFMLAARILNILTFFWLGSFIVNCQHFIVTGTVTEWYFTSDKSGAAGISKSSVRNLFRYHLGSVCYGAIMIPLVLVIYIGFAVVRFHAKFFNMHKIEKVQNFFDKTERFIGTFSKSNYVLILKNGTQFYDSGSKTMSLVMKNVGNLNGFLYFKDHTMLVFQFLVNLSALIVGFIIVDIPNLNHSLIEPLQLVLIFTFMITYCLFTAYGAIVNTLIVCFCIDCEENDGDLSPYFMMNSLKKVIVEIKRNTSSDADNNNVENTASVGTNLREIYEDI